jgi:hypothetical protein
LEFLIVVIKRRSPLLILLRLLSESCLLLRRKRYRCRPLPVGRRGVLLLIATDAEHHRASGGNHANDSGSI